MGNYMRRWLLIVGAACADTVHEPCEEPDPCDEALRMRLPMDRKFSPEIDVLHIAPLPDGVLGRRQAIEVWGTTEKPTLRSWSLTLADGTTLQPPPSVSVLEDGSRDCHWMLYTEVEPLDVRDRDGEQAELTVSLDVLSLTLPVELAVHLD